MRKLLLSVVTIFATNLVFGQLTLEHSFPSNQGVKVFNDGEKIYYFVKKYGNSNNESRNTIHIYNSDYTLYKTITFPWDTTFDSGISFIGDYGISKYVFNTDDKFEFIVSTFSNSTQQSKAFIMNEDGTIIKDLQGYGTTIYDVDIFHDSQNLVNKMRIRKKDGSAAGINEIYLLPTTILTTKEIQGKNKLSAFPIPTNKTLNVINPKNGVSKIEVYDASGKIVMNKSFGISENTISLDVENLSKGIYVYKVGDLSSKFIKN